VIIGKGKLVSRSLRKGLNNINYDRIELHFDLNMGYWNVSICFFFTYLSESVGKVNCEQRNYVLEPKCLKLENGDFFLELILVKLKIDKIRFCFNK
jgi:hypothetical protein